jgi:hypothetical protein
MTRTACAVLEETTDEDYRQISRESSPKVASAYYTQLRG